MKKTFDIQYRFTLPDGRTKEFMVQLDPETLELKRDGSGPKPDWTKLSFQKCPNCPLKDEEHPECPPALAMVDVIDFFKDSLSSEQADVEIVTEGRTYKKKAPLSAGVSGLIGLVMSTSGCPYLGKLKPMVREHLPFATLKESLYRFISMYMLAQGLRNWKGLTPDWEMKGLVKLLDDLRTVNRAFCQRLYAVCRKDASLNALVHLDCFADNTAFFLKRKGLDELARTFTAYFD
ncbi:MAG: hypothetical protein KGL53_09370 [Elusimicrobia bacterium]|nr:hypothetical protein [Elusimicrobiota bacterium]